jgi:hypothetical protein
MIGATELLGAFQGYHIPDILHHANNILLAHTVGTYRTYIGISYIMAALAEPDFRAHPAHYFTKMLHVFRIFF